MRASVTPAMLSHFQWLAGGVEELRARLTEAYDLRCARAGDENEDFDEIFDGVLDPPMFMGMLPELLAKAATASPNLKQLSILNLSYNTGAVVESCACLTQVTKLLFTEMELGLDTPVAQIECLSKLQALEVRCLTLPQPILRQASHDTLIPKTPISHESPPKDTTLLYQNHLLPVQVS